MMKRFSLSLLAMLALTFATSSFADDHGDAPKWVVYEGEEGPGKFGHGKHILFIASDHEYRGEETCPAIARIMAKRYGFKCTVLFGQTEDGVIKPGSSLVPGIDAIDDADMLFLFLRFLKPNDEWMAKFESYFDRGGPVIGLRTTTHAFNGLKGKYAHYNFNTGDKWVGGFGRQILGETWNPKLGAGHYGRNHKYATAMHVAEGQEKHPVMLGVKDMHAMCGAYSAVPMPGSTILANNQVLQSMEVGAPALEGKPPQPAAWVREYESKTGKKGRVFCSTQGASQDILSEGVRRMIVNATLWCMGMEKEIKADADVSFVGPYNPTDFSFKPSVKTARPGDIQGFDTPILIPAKDGAAKKKKILFLAGNPSHASGDHEFRAGCMLLADKLNKSGLPLEATVHYYGWPKDESIFDGVDTCVVYADAAGRFGEKYAFLDKKVQEGMGIMFMHYGVHPSKSVGEKYFLPWIGGYMDDHISVNPHWIADVSAVAKEQVSRGVTPFTALDEFYFNMKFPGKGECDSCRPLAVATPTPDRIVHYINMWNKHGEKCFGTEQALMWCRDPKVGEGGRGVGFVGGHYHRNWAIDDFRRLVMNAIVWTARMEVPKDGVPAGTVTKEELNANLDKKRNIKTIELPTEALYKQKAMPMPWWDENGKRQRGPKPEPALK